MSINAWETWVCPHCKTPNRFENALDEKWYDINSILSPHFNGLHNTYHLINFCKCTVCAKLIIFFDSKMVYPLWAQRTSAPKDVPLKIANDFNEACLVESLSSKAAAALWRRCLQNMFHDQWIKKRDLNLEIDEAMNFLPSHLSEAVDAIRTIWNFSAHPIKYTQTWDIVEVEEWETEWVLDTLEGLFDFYYIAPAKLQAKRDALNIKLKAAWKPNLK